MIKPQKSCQTNRYPGYGTNPRSPAHATEVLPLDCELIGRPAPLANSNYANHAHIRLKDIVRECGKLQIHFLFFRKFGLPRPTHLLHRKNASGFWNRESRAQKKMLNIISLLYEETNSQTSNSNGMTWQQ